MLIILIPISRPQNGGCPRDPAQISNLNLCQPALRRNSCQGNLTNTKCDPPTQLQVPYLFLGNRTCFALALTFQLIMPCFHVATFKSVKTHSIPNLLGRVLHCYEHCTSPTHGFQPLNKRHKTLTTLFQFCQNLTVYMRRPVLRYQKQAGKRPVRGGLGKVWGGVADTRGKRNTDLMGLQRTSRRCQETLYA